MKIMRQFKILLNNSMGNKIGKPQTSQTLQTSQTINELIKQSNVQTACGPACQKKNKIAKLKTNYETAQSSATNAPENLTEARKNYFTYAFGDKYNNEFNEKLYTEQGKTMIDKLTKQHNENVNEIDAIIADYESGFIYANNMGDLTDQYVDKNKVLKQNIDKELSDVETNERKVFYESQQIETIEKWKYIIKLIYWVAVVLYTLVFLYDGMYKSVKNVAILACFIIYPYVIGYILNKLIFVFKFLNKSIPKNVYLSAAEM